MESLIPTMKYKIPVEKGGFFFLSLHSRKTPCHRKPNSMGFLPVSPEFSGLTVWLRFRIPFKSVKIQKPPFRGLFGFLLVGNEGFEPPMPESESGALPLGEFPIEIGTAGII